MNQRNKVVFFAFVFVALAFLVMYEQYLVYGDWWTWSQFLHHESFAFGLVCISFGLIVSMMIEDVYVVAIGFLCFALGVLARGELSRLLGKKKEGKE